MILYALFVKHGDWMLCKKRHAFAGCHPESNVLEAISKLPPTFSPSIGWLFQHFTCPSEYKACILTMKPIVLEVVSLYGARQKVHIAQLQGVGLKNKIYSFKKRWGLIHSILVQYLV